MILRCGDDEDKNDFTIDAKLLTAVRIRAARTGKRDSEVIEEAVRRYLGFDVLDRIWERNDMAEEDAIDLALEAQDEVRRAEDA